MKCFVAGGTGVIGRRAVPALVAAGPRRGGYRSHRGPRRLGRVAWARRPSGSTCSTPSGVESAVAGHDAVINLATHIPPADPGGQRQGVGREQPDPHRGRRPTSSPRPGLPAPARLVQESITFPYADGGDAWIDEDFDRPASAFSGPVDAAEAGSGRRSPDRRRVSGSCCASPSSTPPTPTTSRRGPRRSPEGSTRWSGRRTATRRSSVIDAAGRAVVAALDVASGVYNIADDDPPTRGEAGAAVAAALGRQAARGGSRCRWGWSNRINPGCRGPRPVASHQQPTVQRGDRLDARPCRRRRPGGRGARCHAGLLSRRWRSARSAGLSRARRW